MALKLGELLIGEGLITQAQLDEALRCHVIFGIKLGSSLIELGFVQEEALLDLLSRKLGVSPVSHDELFGVPKEVLKCLSSSVAAKFRVVPIRLEGKRLFVAMSDPTDFKAQEELSFISGHIIVPNIAPEIQILYALEKHYGVRLDHRYVSANCEIKRRRSGSNVEEYPVFITDDDRYTISADMEQVTDSGGIGSGSILEEPAGETVQEESEPLALSDLESIELYNLDRLSQDFAKAESSDDVADFIIRYLSQEFDRCALMTIRAKTAIGWRAANGGRLVKDFKQTTIDLSLSPELGEIFSGKNYFAGMLPETPVNLPLMQALDLSASSPILALRVIMNDRVVAMVVVSAEVAKLKRRMGDLQAMVDKASLAFQILVLKNRLLQG